MSDWALGDLALCLRPGRGRKVMARIGDHYFLENGDRTLRVKRGAIYTVTHAGAIIKPGNQMALGFAESDGPWLASRFIKVTPDAEDDFDRETIELEQRVPAREVVL